MIIFSQLKNLKNKKIKQVIKPFPTFVWKWFYYILNTHKLNSKMNKPNRRESDNVNTIQSNDDIKLDTGIVNVYYYPNEIIINSIVKLCKSLDLQSVLEVGPGTRPFPISTKSIDIIDGRNVLKLDIDTQKIEKKFDFIYSRHVLEDIQNPDFALTNFINASKH